VLLVFERLELLAPQGELPVRALGLKELRPEEPLELLVRV
jgi:hypothetical protein